MAVVTTGLFFGQIAAENGLKYRLGLGDRCHQRSDELGTGDVFEQSIFSYQGLKLGDS
jgi:hypothetical protein